MFPTLKKFFIDDPIDRTQKIYFWCVNVFAAYLPFLYIPFYYLYARRLLRIGKDGRVGMMQAGSFIVRGCDLRCEFCVSFSAYRKGYFPADELLASYAEWRKKIKPKFFAWSGGEPLLHPELPRILREGAKIWNDSKLWLGTNGLLLERVDSEVFQALRESRCKLFVTEHTFDPEHRKKLDAGYARLKQEGIPFVVRPSRLVWSAKYQYKTAHPDQADAAQEGEIVPYDSNPKRAWMNPLNSCDCATISGDQLYKCTYLLQIRQMVSAGFLDADAWKSALTYVPLTLQSSTAEILEHLRHTGMPSCKVCTDKNSIVPARQLPVQKRIDG